MDESSKISKFYDKSQDERISLVKNFGNLSHEQVLLLKEMKPLNFETANRMIENVIGVFPFPFAVATNFKVNGKDYLIPMALEEPSVVAAASNAAKLSSGFKAESTAPIMIGQIQLVNVKNFDQAKKKILENKKALLNECNGADSILVKLGGGAKDLEVKELDTERGKMFLVQLLVDVRDAMGANAVNTMSERISSKLEELSGGETRLRIVSNLAVHRTSKASTT
ncbi:MAG TPA: 3-hydroxy-3-methylglutaryl-CoA reductase, partial [archaeon]|nr:3-hydroxy-3-methylglutaryl-CoA reductase [archaeon]